MLIAVKPKRRHVELSRRFRAEKLLFHLSGLGLGHRRRISVADVKQFVSNSRLQSRDRVLKHAYVPTEVKRKADDASANGCPAEIGDPEHSQTFCFCIC